MAMGKLKKHKQQPLFIAAADLPCGVSHPFYAKLNEVLAGWKFDEFVEGLCARFYHDTMGRPGEEAGREGRIAFCCLSELFILDCLLIAFLKAMAPIRRVFRCRSRRGSRKIRASVALCRLCDLRKISVCSSSARVQAIPK